MRAMTMLMLLVLVVAIVMIVNQGSRIAGLDRRLRELEGRDFSRRFATAVVEARPESEPYVAPPVVEVIVAPVAEEVVIVPPEPEAEPVHEELAPQTRSFGFEDIFGRYLPIWAGGVTLIVAGVLIVKYSIDAGLLSPLVRVIAGLVFGTGLIAGAEAARRGERQVRDERIAQSLAGAGVATLYASILIAVNLYHLVDPMTAFTGLALVTVLAGALSLRFGPPSAVLGLVGGLAAPALVGAESPNIPLLATYLAMTVGGLCALGRNQRWWWLGALAIFGGFGWGLLLIAGGLAGMASALSVGVFTLLLAVVFPMLLIGGESPRLRFAAAVLGCAQMAALVATGGFAGLHWALFELIATALVWLSRREPLFADAPLLGLGVGLMLTVAWEQPTPAMLATVLAIGALIHGGPALLRLWSARARLSDAAQLAAIAAATALVPLFHFHGQFGPSTFAMLALFGAAIAGGTAALGWRHPERTADARFAALSLTAIALTLLAAGLAFEDWLLAPATAVAASAALLLGRAAGDRRVEHGGLAFALLGALFLFVPPGTLELFPAVGWGTGDSHGLIRWLITALVAAAYARWSADGIVRHIAGAAAVAAGYVAAAQIVPPLWLPLVPAAMLFALRRPAQLATAGLIALGWAAYPLVAWGAGAGGAVMAVPFTTIILPLPFDAITRIAAPTAALIFLLWRGAIPERWRTIAAVDAAALAVITLHILWKRVFAIDSDASFTAYGMAERTLWEMLLLALSVAATRAGWKRTGIGLAAASLAHFLWFTALLHNPLWTLQAAGLWLLPAYATAGALLWLLPRSIEEPDLERSANWARISLILLFAASALSQLFHGSMLSVGPITQTEDICRSLLAIAIAIGFLRWGIARADRDWRIASLVLMLGAVGKVFVFDAAGLDGLLRIGSFVALGFSLIGVGWLYSRFLPDTRLTAPHSGTQG
jgi:uncharacterized membrane protein